EDPSDEFVALRDLVSLELCQKYLPDLFSKESILKTNRLTKEMIEKARDICKLTKQEIRRVYEICFLQSININDQEQMKNFRLLVKQRLYAPLQFDKRRRLQLADPTLDALATDPEKRKKNIYLLNMNMFLNIMKIFFEHLINIKINYINKFNIHHVVHYSNTFIFLSHYYHVINVKNKNKKDLTKCQSLIKHFLPNDFNLKYFSEILQKN
ncbi:unnamed protein product, partial [Rotaria magnacalcarata]